MESHTLSPRRQLYDKGLRVVLYFCGFLTCALLVLIIGYIFYRGVPFISWELLSTQSSYINDTIGILPNILNTLYIILLSMVIVLPLGVGAAIYLTEYATNRRLVAVIEFATETLTGIPSIIFGLVGMLFFIQMMGLNMLYGPGNDLVSATAMTAAGAHLILFTTGRGTPFGAPAPTLKLSTNSRLAENKKGWIDFDAGPIVEGESIDDAAKRLLQLVIEVANGKETQTEKRGYRSISIFKDGVVL